MEIIIANLVFLKCITLFFSLYMTASAIFQSVGMLGRFINGTIQQVSASKILLWTAGYWTLFFFLMGL